jgi:hypothetical protein
MAMWESGAYGYLSDYLWWYAVLASLAIHTWCFFRFFPRGRRKKLRLVVGNALVGLCLLVFAGLIAETYLRFVSVETDAYGLTLTTQRWHKAYARRNSFYCRDKEWSEEKPSGTYRIAFVGDSVTYGWGVKDENDRFTNIVQRRFDETRPGRVEVMNVAWFDWDTEDELGAVERIVPEYHIDEVVLCYFPNDIDKLLPTTDGGGVRSIPKPRWINLETSFLLDWLYYRVYARRLPIVRDYCDRLWDGYTDPAIWTKHRQTIAQLVDFCSGRGVRLCVVLVPILRTWGEKFDSAAIHQRVAECFQSLGVSVIDLLPVIQGRDPATLVVNTHDPHPNELAHRLFADAIWTALANGTGESPK